jgi:uncharacterized protein (DUF488 family)
MTQLYSIGHSNQPLEKFLSLLVEHRIKNLVDIRRFPGSRKYPWSNRDNLASSLEAAAIGYNWIEGLGGRRRSESGSARSPNLGLRNEGFRNYADYMRTDDFRHAVDQLVQIADHRRTTMMCAEAVFWRCHRRLVSDFLLMDRKVEVQHIFPSGEVRPHVLTAGATMEQGKLTYREIPSTHE